MGHFSYRENRTGGKFTTRINTHGYSIKTKSPCGQHIDDDHLKMKSMKTEIWNTENDVGIQKREMEKITHKRKPNTVMNAVSCFGREK